MTDAAPPPAVIRIVIVDDDALVRSALTLMLGGQADLEVIGEAPDGRSGIELVRRERPDVVLMDIRMPLVDGLEATAALHADPRPPRIIVLTTFDGDEHVLGAIAAGADGFLLKDTPPADIVDAIHKVAAGETMLSPSATQTLVRRIRDEGESGSPRKAEAEARLAGLTPRERDVAIALGQGRSNAEIAEDLFLSVPTVKAHITRIFDKLGATNRVQIAICVHDAGLV